MKHNRSIFKCEICGNIVGMIEDSSVSVSCCGQEMTPLVSNSTEAAVEKHLPVAKWEGDKLTVTIGPDAHPMTVEHHISWIIVAGEGLTQRITLAKTGAPSATFFLEKRPVTVYGYCNLHGLWAAEA